MENSFTIDPQFINLLISRTADCIETNKDLLTELDSNIGDADHGINMSRGFQAIMGISSELSQLKFGEVLKKAGMTMLTKVGGASGPLYGSLFLGMSKCAPEEGIDLKELAKMLQAGIADVKKRGKSDIGEKTMLDVLAPVLSQLDKEANNFHSKEQLLENIVKQAEEGLEHTRQMEATKGRASFLGKRSIGHLDPGAMSSCLLIKSICEMFNRKQG